VYQILPQVQRQSIFAGEAGENQDQRVFQVRLRIDPTDLKQRSIGGASNLQVNVVFDPLTPAEAALSPAAAPRPNDRPQAGSAAGAPAAPATPTGPGAPPRALPANSQPPRTP
jgi:hypothetical protein